MGILIGIEDGTEKFVLSEILEVCAATFSNLVFGCHYGTLEGDIHEKWLEGWIAQPDGNIADYYLWVQHHGQRGFYLHDNECDCAQCAQLYTFGAKEAEALLSHIKAIGPASDEVIRKQLEHHIGQMTPSQRDWWKKRNNHHDDIPSAFMQTHQEILAVRMEHLEFLATHPDHRLYGAN